ncbi:SRPBCC family protein [Pontibacter sp. MBLB2868]|uniref:SRPBCC family protein n=1 Tax=Pontibacter sp. MBLB2868 TaxID=3451555 RepID=UPI003F74E096
MNLLKIVPLSCVALGAAVYGASFLLPTELQLEHTLVLEATPEQVYHLLNNPTEWEKWSPVNKTTDPSMIRLFGGPMAGVGAKMRWSGDEVGNGEIELTESTEPASVAYKEILPDEATILEGSFRLAAVEGGTAIYWTQKAQLQDKPLAKLKGAWLKYKRQTELEEGLLRLKTLLKKNDSKKGAKRSIASSLN